MALSSARWVAFRVLRKVALEGGFAVDLLHSRFTNDLDERDCALAEELVLGVLRRQGELDWWISEIGGRPVESLDIEVRLALRLGIYQLFHLDRVPHRAAVSQSVEIVKRVRKTSAAGLVNAVLRKVASGPAMEPPLDVNVPSWLLDRWRRHFGEARAAVLAAATVRAPPTYLRLNARFPPDETLRLLAEEGVDTDPTDLPLCRRLRAGGNPARTECFQTGRIRIHDMNSQRVVPLLDLDNGGSFLDLCAAPGNKTFQALEVLGSPFRPGVACDLHHKRLLTMRELATMPVDMVALDAARPLPFSRLFDRILADVPCSGTGTLARNPEIKWKLTPGDIEDLAARQRAILAQALHSLAPRGRLVYSTCSLETEENQGVVDAVVGSLPSFEKIEERIWLPSEHEADGFFACAIHRRAA